MKDWRIGKRLRTPSGIAVALSLLLTLWIPVLSRSHTADVIGYFTDHLHHPFAAWVAITRGPAATYTMPFAQAWQGSSWPHPVREWPTMPAMAYPPGVLLLYLPTALAGAFIPMDTHTFAVVSMLTVLAWAHFSFYRILRLLERLSPGGIGIVAGIFWIQMLEFGLQGFHDSLVFGLCAWAVTLALDNKLGLALALSAAAMSLHFRAGALFAPLGVYLCYRFVREPKSRDRWWGFGILAFVGMASVLALIASLPAASMELNRLETFVAGTRLRFVIAFALVAYAAALCRYGQFVSAAASIICIGMIFSERTPVYGHGAILLAAPLLVGVARSIERAQAAALRYAGVFLFVWLRPMVWQDPADYILQELYRSFLS